jgi:hypothetical protein
MIMKIRDLYYTSKIGDGKYVDNLIDWHTYWINLNYKRKNKIPWAVFNALRCSHREIWTPDGQEQFTWCEAGEWASSPEGRSGKCWTSTMRFDTTKDNKGGVCVRPASQVLKHPDRWFYCEQEIDERQYEKLVVKMKSAVAVNKGYEKKLILRYLGITIDNPDMYICSEFCNELEHMIGIGTKSKNPSPFRDALDRWLEGCQFYAMDGQPLIPAKGNI